MSKSAILILHTGFEELEAVAPIDLLRRAGIDLTLASREASRLVKGRSDIVIQADLPLDAALVRKYDCVVLPGGPGVQELRRDARILNLVKEQAKAERLIAAICAAPLVLNDLGLLQNKRYTAHFSTAEELSEIVESEAVVIDKNLITASGAGASIEFGLAVIEYLVGLEKAQAVAKSICFNHCT